MPFVLNREHRRHRCVTNAQICAAGAIVPDHPIARIFYWTRLSATWHLVIKNLSIWRSRGDDPTSARQTQDTPTIHSANRLLHFIPPMAHIAYAYRHETSCLPAAYVEVFLLKCVAKHFNSLSELPHGCGERERGDPDLGTTTPGLPNPRNVPNRWQSMSVVAEKEKVVNAVRRKTSRRTTAIKEITHFVLKTGPFLEIIVMAYI